MVGKFHLFYENTSTEFSFFLDQAEGRDIRKTYEKKKRKEKWEEEAIVCQNKILKNKEKVR